MKQRPNRSDLIWLASFLIVFPVVILCVYWICFLPAYVAMRIGPPLRSMLIMYYWLSLTFVIESYMAGLTINRLGQRFAPFFLRAEFLRVMRIGVLLSIIFLLIIGPVQATQKLWSILPEHRQFSIDWDARDRLARQAAVNGIRDAVLPQLTDLYGLGPEVGGHFALYYGLLGTITFVLPHP